MIGQTISHYKITEKLGEGGMGVVYRAEDTKLERPVALKFLAPHLLRDEEGRKRFEREAKAAAKLDHPNICTVYEIDEADGRTFIVMAFLEGRPLSERIKEGPLKLPEALSVATQMAEGLEAAHAKGITHRDIKPDNVMLMSGSRGLVKLMDFGLAQLAGSSKFTREGTTLGTVNYMSPEQAEGSPTGQGTDIWSLGVVLYEMVAGQKPFRGDFDQAIVYSIMNEPPELLTAVRTGVPKELERIVNKCLAKKAEERYQGAADLLVDLQALKRELEPQASKVVAPSTAGRRFSPVWIGGAVAVLLAAVGLTWWFSRSSESGRPTLQYTHRQITRDTGFTGEPALSPDGTLLAYASDREGSQTDIYVQQLAGGRTIPLTTHEADDFQPSFSPDGSRIVFVSDRDGGGIYVVQSLGGDPRRIADRGETPRFSPDAEWISYSTVELDSTGQRFGRLHVAPASGGSSRVVETGLPLCESQVWSPDGTQLLFMGSTEAAGIGRRVDLDWWIVPSEGGQAVPLKINEAFAEAGLENHPGFGYRRRPRVWLPDGNSVLFSDRVGRGATNLWQARISPQDARLIGEPQRLTSGTGESQPSASRDGRIAFASSTLDWDIWTFPLGANRAEVGDALERVISGLGFDGFPSVSIDGRKLAYTSSRSGNGDIWLRDLDSGKDKQITVDGRNESRGEISADGTRIAFARHLGEGGRDIYVADLARADEKRIVEAAGYHMDWTPDEKRLLFYTPPPQRWMTVDVETGEQMEIPIDHPDHSVANLRFSPDGQWLALTLIVDRQTEMQTFIAPMEGGRPVEWNHWIAISTGSYDNHPWWSPDSNTLYFLSRRAGFTCIWAQPLDPATKQPEGPIKEVKHFHGRLRVVESGAAQFGYAMLPDRLYLPLSEAKGNIWLAEPRVEP